MTDRFDDLYQRYLREGMPAAEAKRKAFAESLAARSRPVEDATAVRAPFQPTMGATAAKPAGTVETALRTASQAPARERIEAAAAARARQRPSALGAAANVFFDQALSPLSERAADVSTTTSIERAAEQGVDVGKHANLLGAAGAAGATVGYGLTSLINPIKVKAPPILGAGGKVAAGAVEGAVNNALVDGALGTAGAAVFGDKDGNRDIGSVLKQGGRQALLAAKYGAAFGGGGAALRNAGELGQASRALLADEGGYVGRRPADMGAGDAGAWADAARAQPEPPPRPTPEDYVRGLEEGRIGDELSPREQEARPVVTDAMKHATGEASALLEQMAGDNALARQKVPLALAQKIGQEIGVEGFSPHRFAGMTAVEAVERVRVLREGGARLNELVRQLDDATLGGEARVAMEKEVARLEDEVLDSLGRIVTGVGDNARTLAYMKILGKNPNDRAFWFRQAAKRARPVEGGKPGDVRYLPDEVKTEINRIINADVQATARKRRVSNKTPMEPEPGRVNLDRPVGPKDIGAGSTEMARHFEESEGAAGLLHRDDNPLGIERAEELDLQGVEGGGKLAPNLEAEVARLGKAEAKADAKALRDLEPHKVSLDPKAKKSVGADDILPQSRADMEYAPAGWTLEPRADNALGLERVTDDVLEGVTGGGKTGFREVVPENAKQGISRLEREAQAKEDAVRRLVMDEQGVQRPTPEVERKPTTLETAIEELSPEAQQKLAKYIQGLKPAHFWSKAIAFRNSQLLLAPMTWSRNLIGNMERLVVRGTAEQGLATLFDGVYRGAARLNGGPAPTPAARWSNAGLRAAVKAFREQGAQSSGWNTFVAKYREARGGGASAVRALGEGASDALSDISTTHGDLSILDALERPSTNFGDGPVAKVLQALHDFSFGAQGKMDVPYRKAAIARSHMELSEIRAIQEGLQPGTEAFTQRVRDLTSTKGVEVSDLVGAILEVAEEEGLGAVYAGENALASGVKFFKRMAESDNPLTRAVGHTANLVVPFHTVPTNIAIETAKRTPGIGMLFPVAKRKALADLAKQTGLPLQRRAAVQSLAQQTIGGAAMAIGWALAGDDKVSGAYPADAGEQGLFREQNKVSDAVKIGGKWVGLATLGPFALLVGAGAAARRGWEEAREAGAGQGSQVAGALAEGGGATARILSDTPMMTGIKELADARRDQKGLSGFASGATASFVPSWSNFVARQMDPMQDRETREGFLDRTKARIPGWRETLPVRTSPLGRAAPREGGLLKGSLDVTGSRTERTDPVTQEFVRLGVGLREMSKAGAARSAQGVELRPAETPSAHRERRQWVDPKVEKHMAKFIASDYYRQFAGDPAKQAEELRDALNKARRHYTEQYRSPMRGSP